MFRSAAEELARIQTDLVYFAHLVGKDEFERDVLTPLSNVKANEVEQLLARSHYTEVFDSRELVQGILDGKAAIFHNNRVWLVDVYGPRSRNI
ncbi:spore germination protein [Brevibacillus humidisoli]|uniref:spore germination protein n=1 Tax=Brevibacillus humidisoli TaxID=2895522 RepID=UPI001E5FC173|nr:spore germination protein [Brevibacillus humidisoli]UFJ39307.1 spore germination protein [Brevibacillus humidisoli]